MRVQFLYFRDDDQHNYFKMSRAYEIGMTAQDVYAGQTAFIFLTPDSIWSRGSFSRLILLAERGIRAVMVFGHRVSLESFVPAFRACCDKEGLINSRVLAQLALDHQHKITKSFMLKQDVHNIHPAALIWRADKGLVCRAFVFHPLMLLPKKAITKVEESIDYNLVPNSVSRKDIYVVEDSDEILGVDVAEVQYDQASIQNGPLLPYHVLQWFVRGWPTDFHKWLGKHTVVTHADDLGKYYEALKSRIDWTLRYVNTLLYLTSPIRFLMILSKPGKQLQVLSRRVRKRIKKRMKRKFKGKFKGKFKRKMESIKTSQCVDSIAFLFYREGQRDVSQVQKIKGGSKGRF
jgi:hypothetical protein